MRILYGISTVGNGHISRSGEVVRHLKALGHDVRVIFNGDNVNSFWDTDLFAPFEVYQRIRFVSENGEFRVLKTAVRMKTVFKLHWDVLWYDSGNLDLVITDYEPMSARIAKVNGIPCIGISNHYILLHNIPVISRNRINRYMIKHFAPADYPLTLGWHHFEQPILPPIISRLLQTYRPVTSNKIVVYLPFEDYRRFDLFKAIKNYQFQIYCQVNTPIDDDNLHYKPFSRSHLTQDLAECYGVICNAGFNLISEALYLGKKVLAKPVAGHIEQQINGAILAHLNYGRTIEHLCVKEINQWLDMPPPPPLHYPDVAQELANWITTGQWADYYHFAQNVWRHLSHSERSEHSEHGETIPAWN